jgi:hypothetical protein
LVVGVGAAVALVVGVGAAVALVVGVGAAVALVVGVGAAVALVVGVGAVVALVVGVGATSLILKTVLFVKLALSFTVSRKVKFVLLGTTGALKEGLGADELLKVTAGVPAICSHR